MFGKFDAESVVEDVAVVAGETVPSPILGGLAEGVFWRALPSEGIVGLGAINAKVIDVGDLTGRVLLLGALQAPPFEEQVAGPARQAHPIRTVIVQALLIHCHTAEIVHVQNVSFLTEGARTLILHLAVRVHPSYLSRTRGWERYRRGGRRFTRKETVPRV